jgi:hypothetical protein
LNAQITNCACNIIREYGFHDVIPELAILFGLLEIARTPLTKETVLVEVFPLTMILSFQASLETPVTKRLFAKTLYHGPIREAPLLHALKHPTSNFARGSVNRITKSFRNKRMGHHLIYRYNTL